MNAADKIKALDERAKALAHEYQEAGEFAAVVRTVGSDGRVRCIAPQRDIPTLCEFLHRVATAIFNGPSAMTNTQVRPS